MTITHRVRFCSCLCVYRIGPDGCSIPGRESVEDRTTRHVRHGRRCVQLLQQLEGPIAFGVSFDTL